MVGAAVRKPRVPNDKVHRVTDNRLAGADRKILHLDTPKSLVKWGGGHPFHSSPVSAPSASCLSAFGISPFCHST